MSLNATGRLLRDMEQLREHLGVGTWLLRGGSQGVTLSLAYAERHPERVSGMLMLSLTSTRRLELDWLYRAPAGSSPRHGPGSATSPAWPIPTGCRPAARRRSRACSRRTRR
jgi:pimeloyl-ACP methyl ester carboxylesterase